MASIKELSGKVAAIGESAAQLSTMINSAAGQLSQSSGQIMGLAAGSSSGENAAQQVHQAAGALMQSAQVMQQLKSASAEYIRGLAK
jgi:ABC-type phosphate/phosphonate transport system ATPase subunit